jgi:hypothetical protein
MGFNRIVKFLSLDLHLILLCREILDRMDLHMDLHEPRDGEPYGPVIVVDTDSYCDCVDALLKREVLPPVLAFVGRDISLPDRLLKAGCLTASRLDEAFLSRVAKAALQIPLLPLIK